MPFHGAAMKESTRTILVPARRLDLVVCRRQRACRH